MAAYQTGYIDLNTKDAASSVKPSMLDAQKASENLKHHAEETSIPIKEDHSVDEAYIPVNEEQSKLRPDIHTVDGNAEPENNAEPQGEIKGVSSEVTPSEEPPISVTVRENELASFPLEIKSSPPAQTADSKPLSDDTSNMEDNILSTAPHPKQNKTTETFVEQNDGIDSSAAVHEMEQSKTSETFVEQIDGVDFSTTVPEESGTTEAAPDHSSSLEMPKDSVHGEAKAPEPLTESYHLQLDQGSPEVTGQEETAEAYAKSSKDEKVSFVSSGSSKEKKESGEGKIVIDLIEAIDAAKRKQAESDAYAFAEERRILKEKYEKELKDARARELMNAEEAAILEKELNREKAKAAAALKLVQEKAEHNLRDKLQQKEKEAAIQLNKAQELAKAELAATIAKEKASHIENMTEADLNIKALCMAFYARSEEARQTHSVHKLALGTLALEDALSRGMPIRAVVDALHKSVEGIDRDSLLNLALSSLPEETLDYGTSTQMQLNLKFNSLKGNLRHFSIIPAGGGGILTHAVAHLASSIKVKEDQSGQGIESLISKVESLLVEGEIAEAADALEGGVRGSEAEELVAGWVKQARNRAVVEQAHSLLQSYATSITFA